MKKNEYVFGENSIINKAAGILSCYKEGDALIKAYNDDIAKAEGARGGKVIGHTKSGKPIYESANHESHKNFSIAEHDDAINAHQKVRDDYHKNNNSTDEDKKANDHAFEQQKAHIGAKNRMLRDMTPAQARAAVAESEANNVKKSERDDISKGGGEGSRGGKVIGHTKSGKPVYAKDETEGKAFNNWTPDEHREAAAHHKKAMASAKGEDKEDHEWEMEAHLNEADDKEKQNKNKKIETAEDGSHSIEHKGSKYHSKPDESKEDFSKRVKQTIKEDHKDDVEFKKSVQSSDLQKAYETLGLGDLIQKGGRGSGRRIGSTSSGKAIYDNGDYSTGWNSKEHNEAAEAHAKMADKLRESKDQNKRELSKMHDKRYNFHTEWAKQKKEEESKVEKSESTDLQKAYETLGLGIEK